MEEGKRQQNLNYGGGRAGEKNTFERGLGANLLELADWIE